MRGALGPWTLGHGQAGVLKGFVNKPNPFQTLPFKGQGKDNHSRVTQKKASVLKGFVIGLWVSARSRKRCGKVSKGSTGISFQGFWSSGTFLGPSRVEASRFRPALPGCSCFDPIFPVLSGFESGLVTQVSRGLRLPVWREGCTAHNQSPSGLEPGRCLLVGYRIGLLCGLGRGGDGVKP